MSKSIDYANSSIGCQSRRITAQSTASGVRNDRHVAALPAGDGVAVRLRLRGQREADGATRTAAIFAGEPLAEQADEGVVGWSSAHHPCRSVKTANG